MKKHDMFSEIVALRDAHPQPEAGEINPWEAERQGIDTTIMRMRAAVNAIDADYGQGYAKAHPELVGAFMQSVAADVHTCHQVVARGEGLRILHGMADTLGDLRHELTSGLEVIADKMRDTAPESSNEATYTAGKEICRVLLDISHGLAAFREGK